MKEIVKRVGQLAQLEERLRLCNLLVEMREDLRGRLNQINSILGESDYAEIEIENVESESARGTQSANSTTAPAHRGNRLNVRRRKKIYFKDSGGKMVGVVDDARQDMIVLANK